MNSKIRKARYVIYAPKGLRTGGPEAMHQLHWAISKTSEVSILLPWHKTKKNDVVNEYEKYSPNWCSIRSLNKNDIFIVGETILYLPLWYFFFISKKNIFKWMLSVEFSTDPRFNNYERKNFKLNSKWNQPIVYPSKLKRVLRKVFIVKAVRLGQACFKFLKRRFLMKKITVDYTNYLFQSNYARINFQKATNSNFGNMLTDFTESDASSQLTTYEFCSCTKKHVLYYPAKSKELIAHILHINCEKNDEIHFVAISGLSHKEVLKVFTCADLYLDLGYFPGKDRLPREAIRMHCPVLLAKRGSARYYQDFPLEGKYLLDLEMLDAKSTYGIIVNMLSNGKKENLLSQEEFRNSVLQEKSIFLNEVNQFVLSRKHANNFLR